MPVVALGPSFNVCLPLMCSPELLDTSERKFVCRICRIGKQEFVMIMTATAKEDNFRVNSVKLMYFFKNIFFSTPRQTE